VIWRDNLSSHISTLFNPLILQRSLKRIETTTNGAKVRESRETQRPTIE
jgi:hypothetical protein